MIPKKNNNAANSRLPNGIKDRCWLCSYCLSFNIQGFIPNQGILNTSHFKANIPLDPKYRKSMERQTRTFVERFCSTPCPKLSLNIGCSRCGSMVDRSTVGRPHWKSMILKSWLPNKISSWHPCSTGWPHLAFFIWVMKEWTATLDFWTNASPSNGSVITSMSSVVTLTILRFSQVQLEQTFYNWTDLRFMNSFPNPAYRVSRICQCGLPPFGPWFQSLLLASNPSICRCNQSMGHGDQKRGQTTGNETSWASQMSSHPGKAPNFKHIYQSIALLCFRKRRLNSDISLWIRHKKMQWRKISISSNQIPKLDLMTFKDWQCCRLFWIGIYTYKTRIDDHLVSDLQGMVS